MLTIRVLPMASTSRGGAYPAGVPGWLTGDVHRSVLDVASGRGGLAGMLIADGHRVTCLDHDLAAARRLAERRPGLDVIAAQVESLPFDSCVFDLVTAAQTLHRFAPGLALPEIARVLRPEGRLGIVYNARDDSVPWVRKLTGLMQAADSTAMRGAYGTESVNWVAESPYFTDLIRQDFRNWTPITRQGLLDMVGRRPGTRSLSADRRDELLAEVGGLYDSYARRPDPLMLPFTTTCWLATVDHTELTVVDLERDALHISFNF